MGATPRSTCRVVDKFRLPPISRFTAILLAISLGLAAIGMGGWWWLQRSSPLHFQAEQLHEPAAARFLPRSANLSFYLQLDPNQLPAYGRAVARSKQRNSAANALTKLRDGLFATTGLNYNNELSNWIGPELAIALTASSNNQIQPSWVLALSSRTSTGAREFLQTFWQTRSLAGGDLSISSYRGLGLISSSNPEAPLATALINDQLVLVASRRDALEDALDSSQVDALNQSSDPQLQNWLKQNRKGVALLRSDASGISQLLGLPAKLVAEEQLQQLVGSIAVQGSELQLAAQISTGIDRNDPPLGDRANQWLQQLRHSADQINISNASGSINSLLTVAVTKPGPLLDELQRQNQGPLLLALINSNQWLAATDVANPSPEALNQPLHLAGFDPTSINSIDVWSRLSGQTNRAGELKAILAGASGSKANVRWWSNNFDELQNQLQTKGVNKKAPFIDAQSVAFSQLGPKLSRDLLGHWSFWQGLQLLAAQPLSPAVNGLEYMLEEDKTSLDLKATLHFS